MTLTLRDIGRTVDGAMHLEHIELALEPGSLNVLLGPTLAGKTSLMRVMAGLDKPSSGRLMVDGEDVTGMSVRDPKIPMVYQQSPNYPPRSLFINPPPPPFFPQNP